MTDAEIRQINRGGLTDLQWFENQCAKIGSPLKTENEDGRELILTESSADELNYRVHVVRLAGLMRGDTECRKLAEKSLVPNEVNLLYKKIQKDPFIASRFKETDDGLEDPSVHQIITDMTIAERTALCKRVLA